MPPNSANQPRDFLRRLNLPCSVAYSALRFFKIFFANGSLISACRGTASIAPFFGLIQGQIDFRIEKVGVIERLEFSWEGQDENNEALGRGWAIIKNNFLVGRFYFHLGDNSAFKAKKLL
jgi:hypothetical protein